VLRGVRNVTHAFSRAGMEKRSTVPVFYHQGVNKPKA